MKTTISPIQGLLIDLDGTIYHGSSRIEGADRFIAYLRESGMPYRYVTNNSASSPVAVAERLTRMGIPAAADEVCTSAQAAAVYVAQRYPEASVFVIGEAGLQEELEGAGLRLDDQAPDVVVQGIDRSVTYDRIAQAANFIRAGADYILTNPDLLVPSTDGLIPGAGSISAMLRAASGKAPHLIGKPSPVLMNYALERLGLGSDDTCVIGDNLATDIAAGLSAGCSTLLVLTGLTTKDNYESYAESAGLRPDGICETLDQLIAVISDNR